MQLRINGRSFTVNGSLSQINGKWYDGTGQEIDLFNLEETKNEKVINITIEGNVERLQVDCCNMVAVNGNVRKVDTASGDVQCRVIEGDADTGSGNITCDTIEGDADTGSGNIHANKIGGKADTGSGHIYEAGVRQGRTSRNDSSVIVNQVFGSVFGNTTTRSYTSGEVITGGMRMTRDANGTKHIYLHKDCTVNGRRIGDMTKEELNAWIAEKARHGKIVTIE